VNGADGIGDMEGKAAMGSGEQAGKRASFKSVVSVVSFAADSCLFVSIRD